LSMLVTAIHAFIPDGKTWMAGTRTSVRSLRKLDCFRP
jgi:hypothetical protein